LSCFAFVFARGGSKGVKRKNIRDFAGKPLIAYSIEIAKASPLIDEVFVSTDDAEIAEVARRYGAEVPFIRPSSLAQDNSPEWLVWQHAVKQIKTAHPFDVFVSLPTTAPLRVAEDVENCIKLFSSIKTDVVVTASEARRNPYFNMLKLDEHSEAHLVCQPSFQVEHRQSAPKVYDMETVAYVTSPHFILQNQSLFDGKMSVVVIPSERAIDIDTELDFKMAEFLYLNRGQLSEKKSEPVSC